MFYIVHKCYLLKKWQDCACIDGYYPLETARGNSLPRTVAVAGESSHQQRTAESH